MVWGRDPYFWNDKGHRPGRTQEVLAGWIESGIFQGHKRPEGDGYLHLAPTGAEPPFQTTVCGG